eukprot:5563484-Amphidinium_carterae.1
MALESGLNTLYSSLERQSLFIHPSVIRGASSQERAIGALEAVCRNESYSVLLEADLLQNVVFVMLMVCRTYHFGVWDALQNWRQLRSQPQRCQLNWRATRASGALTVYRQPVGVYTCMNMD